MVATALPFFSLCSPPVHPHAPSCSLRYFRRYCLLQSPPVLALSSKSRSNFLLLPEFFGIARRGRPLRRAVRALLPHLSLAACAAALPAQAGDRCRALALRQPFPKHFCEAPKQPRVSEPLHAAQRLEAASALHSLRRYKRSILVYAAGTCLWQLMLFVCGV
eukprot:5193194-Pleurochrysis_carterae.AAC.1